MSGDAYIALETGQVITGRCRSPGTAHGELVFTTAYTGYEESLTDPSYAKQILTFAYPLIGNYGVREDRFESSSIQPEAAIAREFDESVPQWLKEEGVPAVDRVDTRALVTAIRDGGAMQCGIATGPDATPDDAIAQLNESKPMSSYETIGATVSTPVPRVHNQTAGTTSIALIDCGVKQSIIDAFTDRGACVHHLPHDISPREVREIDPDLVFISNGPGDPQSFTDAITVVRDVIGDIPLAGICLGQQIIALAAGGETEKMKFGHRGVNQPVYDQETNRVLMTTQNHGYAVSDPGTLTVTQYNVNDDSAEGLADYDRDIVTRQYHPEANPGPQDAFNFFNEVLELTEHDPESLATQSAHHR